MKEIKKVITVFLIFFLFISGCAALEKTKPPFPPVGDEEVPVSLQKEMLSDNELFNLGLSYLSSPDLNPDYPNAFLAFKRLTENYPESRWNDIAQHFTTLLERYLKLSIDNSRLSLENQDLSKDKKLLTDEKARWEEVKGKLQKEITSLKSDLENLKQIEIESEKREKNIR